MKRILLAFALVFVFCMSSLAQKTYVTVSFNPQGGAVLSGDVPAKLQRHYVARDVPKEERYRGGTGPEFWMGYLINLLAKEGFTVEHVLFNHTTDEYVYLLSKPVPEDKKEDKKE